MTTPGSNPTWTAPFSWYDFDGVRYEKGSTHPESMRAEFIDYVVGCYDNGWRPSADEQAAITALGGPNFTPCAATHDGHACMFVVTRHPRYHSDLDGWCWMDDGSVPRESVLIPFCLYDDCPGEPELGSLICGKHRLEELRFERLEDAEVQHRVDVARGK